MSPQYINLNAASIYKIGKSFLLYKSGGPAYFSTSTAAYKILWVFIFLPIRNSLGFTAKDP